ncbi:MAG: hypothetical protein PHR35_16945, partial [Kiritimatiellae bacterium]|nr:hypothetical protein [Kiritimatiellia bacterium]
MTMDGRRLPGKVEFSRENFVIIADANSAADPEYVELFRQHPLADGLRDISTCYAYEPADLDGLFAMLRSGEISFACVGWLLFSPFFTKAAAQKGLSAREYADELYAACAAINAELGYRAAWIEVYGEIGNSIYWPKDQLFSRSGALEYFRAYLRDGRMLTEHWSRQVPAAAMNYYAHAKSVSEDFRALPVYYSEGTLFSIQEAYRNGFPLVAYESQCCTMNQTQTGLAFARGGAKAYNAWWGVDISPWTGGPLGELCAVNALGRWRAGVTPDH